MKRPFKFPPAFLKQLEEFTNGYYLVIVNSESNFENFMHLPNELVEYGLINHVDVQISSIQEAIRQKQMEANLGGAEDEDDEME